MDKSDKETQAVMHEYQTLESLVNHEGWGIARIKLVDRITDLQNAFNIESKNAEEMLIDLQARKIATAVLLDWIKEIEGTAQANQNVNNVMKPYIVRENLR